MNFGIIGYGRFGKLWAEVLLSYGNVLVYDKNNQSKNTPIEEVVKTDMLFLLVPISEIENCCQEIAPILDPDTIVIDACSVKVHPAQVMKDVLPNNQPLIASHPLFGPDSVKRMGLKNQKIVVSPIRVSKEEQDKFAELLKKMELKIIYATPEEHDRQMAASQALVHFLGRALADLGLKEQEISTPDFQSLLKINDLVSNDTWQLFLDMQQYNPFAKDVRRTLIEALERVEKKIAFGI